MPDRLKLALAALLLVSAGALAVRTLGGCQAGGYVEPKLGAADHVREALHGDEARSRLESIAALGKSEDPLARTTLEKVLEQADAPAPVVAAAARALGRRKDPRSVRAIAKRLEDPAAESVMVKAAAIRALERIGHPGAFDALRKQVTPQNPVAADAVWAMGRLRDPETGRLPPGVEGQLIAYLAHPIPKVRMQAIDGLRAGGTERALPELEELLKKPLNGIRSDIRDRPLPDWDGPKSELIAAPCRRAIEAIRQRLGKEGG